MSFNYLADAVDRAVAWTAPNFVFFNGTNLFLYPAGRGFNWPARVSVRTEASWRIATGMDAAPGTNNFTAGNYHDLTDMPFYVGRFAIDSTRIAGKWIRLAFYPTASLTTARRDRTFAWLQKFVPAQIAVFGEAPFRNYTVFQRSDTVVNGGGLEHQSSQVDEVTTSQLDASYLPGLYSHEFFHAWNVKRLRPADMVPYRYDDAQPTTWLWVSEGVTDYYGALALVRGGGQRQHGVLQLHCQRDRVRRWRTTDGGERCIAVAVDQSDRWQQRTLLSEGRPHRIPSRHHDPGREQQPHVAGQRDAPALRRDV